MGNGDGDGPGGPGTVMTIVRNSWVADTKQLQIKGRLAGLRVTAQVSGPAVTPPHIHARLHCRSHINPHIQIATLFLPLYLLTFIPRPSHSYSPILYPKTPTTPPTPQHLVEHIQEANVDDETLVEMHEHMGHMEAQLQSFHTQVHPH